MKIRTVIADDESQAREVLRQFIEKYAPQLDIIDEAENAQIAIEKINKQKPQLIFLDVEMPFGNAFDVLENIEYQEYQVIFVTAYSQYSMQALNNSVAYYILKPIDIDELTKAVAKVEKEIEKELSFENKNVQVKSDKTQLILPTQSGFDLVKITDILRLEADGNFTKIFFTDGSTQLVCRFLKHFENALPLPFMRVHRSHIVNLDYTISYQKSGGGMLTMKDNYEIDISDSYKNKFLSHFLE